MSTNALIRFGSSGVRALRLSQIIECEVATAQRLTAGKDRRQHAWRLSIGSLCQATTDAAPAASRVGKRTN